jgi:hypothetical protein
MIEEHVKFCLLSKLEPKTIFEVCKDENGFKDMKEELEHIKKNQIGN